MENKKTPTQEKEQEIKLINKKLLSVSGTNKIISLKPDLIQLNTVYGDLQILGSNLELIKLDNINLIADISGNICALKFIESRSKEPLFRKIFKWFFQHKAN